MQHGYIQSHFDYSPFSRFVHGKKVDLLVYVDDLLINGLKRQLVDNLEIGLHSQFKLKTIGNLKNFLGLEVTRSKVGPLTNANMR